MDIFVVLVVIVTLVLSSVLVTSSLWRADMPRSWRTRVQVGAWVLSAASAALFFGTTLWARIMGGFPYYDPTLMAIYTCGFFTALLGLVLGAFGVGRIRLSVVALSVTMVFVWAVLGASE